MQHLLSIETLSREEITRILYLAAEMKRTRGHHAEHPLRHQCWALIFSKSSTRTRVSFEVGIRELGGDVMFLAAADIQLGRGEPIRDTARVMGRMLHGAVIRTFAQSDVTDFAEYSGIPTINALTDDEHPCQILADLQTIQEKRGSLNGVVVCFAGDGACNVARSWLWAAARCGFELRIAAPAPFQPAGEAVAAAFPQVESDGTRTAPSGETMETVPRAISTRAIEPSCIHTGPSGNRSPVATTRIVRPPIFTGKAYRGLCAGHRWEAFCASQRSEERVRTPARMVLNCMDK